MNRLRLQLQLYNLNRPRRWQQFFIIMSVLCLLLTTAQASAWQGSPNTMARASTTLDNGDSMRGGTGGHRGVLPPSGGPGIDPASTPKPKEPNPTPDKGKEQSPTPDKGKATDTPIDTPYP